MLNALAFGCGWASVALGLALGRLALGLALAAQLLQRGRGGQVQASYDCTSGHIERPVDG